MATITTKETRDFNWANPGTLKVGDEIAETLKDGREVTFVIMDEGVIGLKNLLGYHCMNEDWTNEGGFQFEYFKDRRNRIKIDEYGDTSWWWLRSFRASNSYYFCAVSSNGSADYGYTDSTLGVCFGFYIFGGDGN